MATEHDKIEQEFGTVGSSPLMLNEDITKPLIEALNQDLASLYLLHHQYHKHQWVVAGPQYRQLEQLFTMHADQVEAAAIEIGERINALGGVPAATMRKQLEVSYLEEEPDGILGVRDMLQRDVDAERAIAGKLREHIRLATQLGDWGSEDLLKETLQDTEKRADFAQKHLEFESLGRGLVSAEPRQAEAEPTIQEG
jgi:starvation-inducible DNA-binding protein